MDTIKFDKKVECCPEFVAVRIIENYDEMQAGNIWLPAKTEANSRIAFCQIESVGSTAAKEYGLKIGDYVIIDRLSTFAHTSPVACLKYTNVLCLTNADQSEHYPLRNMIFVEPDDNGEPVNVGGIYVNDNIEKLRLGTVRKMNVDADLDMPFNVGDKVMLTKGADVIDFCGNKIYIYKHDMIIAKIMEK